MRPGCGPGSYLSRSWCAWRKRSQVGSSDTLTPCTPDPVIQEGAALTKGHPSAVPGAIQATRFSRLLLLRAAAWAGPPCAQLTSLPSASAPAVSLCCPSPRADLPLEACPLGCLIPGLSLSLSLSLSDTHTHTHTALCPDCLPPAAPAPPHLPGCTYFYLYLGCNFLHLASISQFIIPGLNTIYVKMAFVTHSASLAFSRKLLLRPQGAAIHCPF